MTIGYAVRYHWLWLAATLMAALLVAGAIAHERQPTYQATSLVQVDTTDAVGQGAIDVTSQETRATQIMQLIEGTPFLSGVCHTESAHGLRCTPQGLQRQMSLSLVKSTTMIAITISAPRAAWATSLANAIATATVQQQAQEARQFYAKPINSRTAQAQGVAAQISQEEQQIATIASNPAIPVAQQNEIAAPLYSQLDILQSDYAALATDLQNLQVSELQDEDLLTVAQRAQVPSRPADPSLSRYLAVGGTAGLVLGFLLMLLAARLDGRLRHGQRLAETAGLPFVFELPRGSSLAKTQEACVPAVAGLLGRQPKARSMLLVPADPTIEVPTAAALVRDALSVFGARDVRVVVEQGLAVPALDGARLTDGIDTMTPESAFEALPEAKQGGSPKGSPEFVVFATEAPARSALATLLAPRVDLVVLVASERTTRVKAVERAAFLLRHAGADITAGILVCGQGQLPEPAAAPELATGPEFAATPHLAATPERLGTSEQAAETA